MSTEVIKWWQDGSELGTFHCIHDDDGNLQSECNPVPNGATELTEAEFADLLRVQHVGARDAWVSAQALASAEIAQIETDRQAQVDDLVASGVSSSTAEAIVPAVPASPFQGDYEAPPGAADALRANYRLSQASIDLIVAPIEGP